MVIITIYGLLIESTYLANAFILCQIFGVFPQFLVRVNASLVISDSR